MPDKDTPIQHTPKHLVKDEDVFDRRHPAASSFAPLQPGLGVVADDADERGQNLQGGPKASDAHRANMDQREKLVENQERDLREKSGVGDVDVAAVKVESGAARPASPAPAGKSTDPRSPETK